VGLKFEYATGATPLDPDEAAGLIPSHITTQQQLNEWELANILEGERWAIGRKRKDLLSIQFVRTLHKRMFGNTWRWAGIFRGTGKNIGVAPANIQPELMKLCEDVIAQLEHKSYTIDEIAARFHHRLVSIHPFANGNGRHARLMTDLLLVQNGAQRFTWGKDDLVAEGTVRKRYIQALQAADRRDYGPLLKFVRSGKGR
jgi:Fic-DOC domain mobile mystery protein B